MEPYHRAGPLIHPGANRNFSTRFALDFEVQWACGGRCGKRMCQHERMAKAKRHHFVPRAYLERFGRDDRVAVRWRDRSDIVVTGTLNVAVEAGFYTTEELDGSKSVIVEESLAEIDGEAHAVIEAVLSDGMLPGPGSSQRETLAYYLAIQKSRTPEARGFASFSTDVLAYAGGRTVDSELIADYLEHVHLGFKPAPGEVAGALTFVQARTEFYPPAMRNEIVTLPLSSVERVASMLLSKHWSLADRAQTSFDYFGYADDDLEPALS